MAEFDFEFNGLKFINFLSNSKKVTITVDLLPGEVWHHALARIIEWAGENLSDGTYRVHLGNEELLTDESAEFVVYCLEEESPRVRQRWLGESF